jgi:hypothetical protein
MSKYNFEWWSNDMCKEVMYAYFEIKYRNFQWLIEKNYKTAVRVARLHSGRISTNAIMNCKFRQERYHVENNGYNLHNGIEFYVSAVPTSENFYCRVEQVTDNCAIKHIPVSISPGYA